MISVLLSLIVLAWGVVLIGGTAYLVVMYGWSVWWFAPAVLLAMSMRLRS